MNVNVNVNVKFCFRVQSSCSCLCSLSSNHAKVSMVIVGLNIKMDGALGYKFESFCVTTLGCKFCALYDSHFYHQNTMLMIQMMKNRLGYEL